MPDYRRNYVPGGTYFFTVVTAGRRPVFASATAVALLRDAVRGQQRIRPFRIMAAVVLPDHLHMIWVLPAGDSDYSIRWSAIKAAFTKAWLESGGIEGPITSSNRRDGRRGVWQSRFIEHTCRDPRDLNHHIDYIHYNPVKHGYVTRPSDWPYSSIHRFITDGTLPADWGALPASLRTSLEHVDASLLE